MMTMTPINPPVRDRKREKHEYQQLKSETDMAQSRLHYGTLERMHKTKSDMQRQALPLLKTEAPFIGTGVDVFTTGTVKNVAGGGAYTMLMAT